MLQDRATGVSAPAYAILPGTLERYFPSHDPEFGRSVGARDGFDGLIASRGRQTHRHSVQAPAARPRTVAAVPGASASNLQVGVAESSEHIEAVDRLIRARYAWRGYSLDASDRQSASAVPNAAPRDITFFATEHQATLGTITLRLDGPAGLRAEATHGKALRRARADGRWLGELTRLALAEDVDSRRVLASLFGLVYAIGRWVHGVTDVFIEVNPRHVVFYSRALGFIVLGEARLCERVGAPSVLLHADVELLGQRLAVATGAPAPEEPAMAYGT